MDRTQLFELINLLFPDNTAGEISEADGRLVLKTLFDTALSQSIATSLYKGTITGIRNSVNELPESPVTGTTYFSATELCLWERGVSSWVQIPTTNKQTFFSLEDNNFLVRLPSGYLLDSGGTGTTIVKDIILTGIMPDGVVGDRYYVYEKGKPGKVAERMSEGWVYTQLKAGSQVYLTDTKEIILITNTGFETPTFDDPTKADLVDGVVPREQLPAFSSLSLGTGMGDAARGDQGLTAYNHSQSDHAPVNAEPNVNPDWNSIAGKSEILNKPDLTVYVEKVAGKGLSTEDYTTLEKTKLANMGDFSTKADLAGGKVPINQLPYREFEFQSGLSLYIDHQMEKYPHTMCLDSTGREVIIETQHHDRNTLTASWAREGSGTIICS